MNRLIQAAVGASKGRLDMPTSDPILDLNFKAWKTGCVHYYYSYTEPLLTACVAASIKTPMPKVPEVDHL